MYMGMNVTTKPMLFSQKWALPRRSFILRPNILGNQ